MTRGLDKGHDWTFGNGLNNYKTGDEEIAQNVKTRLLSFENDWFLDEGAEIDWLTLLGQKNNKKAIEEEVYRVTMATEGVLRVNRTEVTVANRNASIIVEFDTINNENITSEVTVNG